MAYVISDEELASILLARVRKILQGEGEIEQVDFYDCRQDDPQSTDIVAWVYLADGRECSLNFTRPPLFDDDTATTVELMMCRGQVDALVLH
jgi:hypothetical protein